MSDTALEAAVAGGERAPVRTARIAGLGHYAPERVVPNALIAERIGVDDEWIVRRTGIRSRRWAAEDETLADMAVAAGTRALADAGVDAAAIDLVLVATMTADQICPNAAPVVAHALGAHAAGAIDVGAACTGWLAGLRLAAGQVESGRAERVLLIGADRLSSLLNLDDPATASLFGDGAGAVVIAAGDERSGDEGSALGRGVGIGPIVLASDGSLGDRITAGYGDDRALKMDGHSTYQVAVKRLTECTVAACERAGVELDDIDLFVYHQANGRIIRAVGQRLELPEERVADYVAGMANTSAASIPLALGLLREDGRLRIGHRVLVAAIGGGFTWGAGVVEWGIG
jgi:3-oxoacyl-[acyl-carrier-protein] synthase-3